MKTFRRIIIVMLSFSVIFLALRITKLEKQVAEIKQQQDSIYYDSNDRMQDMEYYIEQLIDDLVERQGIWSDEL